jgi:thymidylate synthase (FAD)
MANINEVSGRYSILEDTFYRPEKLYNQSLTNNQGSDGEILSKEILDKFDEYIETDKLYKSYEELIKLGVSREIARIGLPVNLYTSCIWKIDLHNLLNFLRLRMDSHAQQEIREYANAIYDLILPVVPITLNAFSDYKLGSISLSKLEIEAIKTKSIHHFNNKTELAEFEKKKRLLDL